MIFHPLYEITQVLSIVTIGFLGYWFGIRKDIKRQKLTEVEQ